MKNLFLFALVLLMASCEQIHEGTIVDKVAEPAYSYTTMQSHHIGKATYFTPYTHYVRPHWKIRIRGKLEGKTEYRTLYVSQYDFEILGLGQYYRLNNDD